MTLPRTIATFLIAGALSMCTAALAQNTEHGHKKETHFKVTPPTDVKAAWTLIATKVSEVEKDLAAKNVDAIHESAEHLEAAVHVLQEQSTMVAGDKQARLASALKHFDTAIDDLHHAAEAKEVAQISLELAKIKNLLPLIEAQFPLGTLK